ncbi:MAG: DJ-1/PfpI family protein [Bacillota bacterium]|nr:DJ-1/PfpI family protein [Bacillota bacterium]HHU61927.1 DJ-1/PfpI family protein [Natronincola sp.]
MKTVALIIAEKEFRDEEYQIPHDLLHEAGFKVLTVSTTLEQAIGKLGMVVQPDTLIENLEPKDIDALIFIGGGGSEQYFEDPLSHRLAQEMILQNKVLGAICIAPVILANALVLKGKKATVYPDGKDILIETGAIYTASPVEIDGKLITGNGPEAAEEFGKALIKLLQ